jgi:hypothetical protein
VPARIGRDQLVCAEKLLSPGILPIFVAACHAMQKQQWLSIAVYFVVQLNSVCLQDAHRSSPCADLW